MGLTLRSLTDGQKEDQAAAKNAALIFLHENCSVGSPGVRGKFSKPTSSAAAESREPPVGRRERRSDAQRRAWQRMVRSSLSTLTLSAGRTDGIGNEAASCRSAVLAVNIVIDHGGKNVKGFEGT